MTTDELLALIKTRTPEQLQDLLTSLRRERRSLEPQYRTARRTRDGVAVIWSSASITRLDHQMAQVRYELSTR